MPVEKRIPFEIAHKMLATFGINEPSPLYERRVKPEGFTSDDLHEVLAESRFVFGIDWCAAMPDELALIAAAISELGARLDVEVADDTDGGWVACGGKRAPVKYVPTDEDDFTDVIVAVQNVLPEAIEFREATNNGSHDGWEFAVLLREEWSRLDTLDRELVEVMFRPLATRSH